MSGVANEPWLPASAIRADLGSRHLRSMFAAVVNVGVLLSSPVQSHLSYLRRRRLAPSLTIFFLDLVHLLFYFYSWGAVFSFIFLLFVSSITSSSAYSENPRC
ncbi:hypothetical protein C8J57DRAFT_1375082 [Mycena rebaudengoi]|nr:hypothetical protein C8J57DRAFT_1375082 [Mycena rebaudengoi]